MRVFLYYIGKPRDPHLNEFAGEFLKRTRRYANIEMREIDPRRFDLPSRHPQAVKVMLDPAGKTMSSAEFIRAVENWEREARDVLFLIGSADGLPSAWRPQADLLLSLSPMTFPHELARALLCEQIYRAFTFLRGHPYPR